MSAYFVVSGCDTCTASSVFLQAAARVRLLLAFSVIYKLFLCLVSNNLLLLLVGVFAFDVTMQTHQYKQSAHCDTLFYCALEIFLLTYLLTYLQ